MSDPNAQARLAAQEQGRRTLARIAQEEQDAITAHATDKITTIEDVDSILWARQQTAIAADLAERNQRIVDLHNEPVPSESRNKFQYLTNDEIVVLDRLEKQKAAQQEESERSYRSMAQFLLANPSVPATPKAGSALVQHCSSQGQGLTYDNLSKAWEHLKASGQIRPDYSNRNKAAHEESEDQLRSMGIDVPAPPDPNSASGSEIHQFLGTQPRPGLEVFAPPSTEPSAWDSPLQGGSMDPTVTKEQW
jgi:hypothetical protein